MEIKSDDCFNMLGQISVAKNLSDYHSILIKLGNQLFDPQSVIVVVFHRTSRPRVIFRSILNLALEQRFDNIYNKIGYMLDPFYQHAFLKNGIQAHRLREIAPDRFEKSDYFSRYFQETRMVDELGALYKIDSETAVHLSMGRSEGSPRYRNKEIKMFKSISLALMPKLTQLIESAKDIPDIETKQSELSERFLQHPLTSGKKLSSREVQIATLIVQGHSSRSIALNLDISPQTVKVHRRNLYSKLGISAQNELYMILMKPYL